MTGYLARYRKMVGGADFGATYLWLVIYLNIVKLKKNGLFGKIFHVLPPIGGSLKTTFLS
jgi:hypothetical protein